MIIEALLLILGAIYRILVYPLSLIPDGSTYILKFGSSMSVILDYAYGWNFILPVTEALIIFAVSILITVGISIYYTVIFFLRLLRGF